MSDPAPAYLVGQIRVRDAEMFGEYVATVRIKFANI